MPTQIECPLCKQVTKKRIEELPKNRLIVQFLELNQQKSSNESRYPPQAPPTNNLNVAWTNIKPKAPSVQEIPVYHDFSTNQIEPVVVNENYGSPQTLADMSLLDLSINNTDSLFGTATQQGIANKQMKLNEHNDFIEPGAFSGVSLLKVDKNISSSVCLNQSRNGNSNFSLSNRRSDIIVEWTDSVNILFIFECF